MKTRRLLSLLLALVLGISPSMTALAAGSGIDAAAYQQEAAAVDIPGQKSSETVELQGMEIPSNEVQEPETPPEEAQELETSPDVQNPGGVFSLR